MRPASHRIRHTALARVQSDRGSATLASVIRHSKLFELLANKEIPAKKSGGQTLIEVSALDAWIDSLPPARAS